VYIHFVLFHKRCSHVTARRSAYSHIFEKMRLYRLTPGVIYWVKVKLILFVGFVYIGGLYMQECLIFTTVLYLPDTCKYAHNILLPLVWLFGSSTGLARLEYIYTLVNAHIAHIFVHATLMVYRRFSGRYM